MKHPRLLFAFVAVALSLLLALGSGQVKRLYWKQVLLERIAASIDDVPRVYRRSTEARNPDTHGDGSFERVTASGAYDHGSERLVYRSRDGQPGFLVFTPLRLEGEAYRVFVSRGFVAAPPQRMGRPDFARPEGRVSVSGITRRPEPRGPFDPAADLKRGIWYAADLSTMHEACGTADFDCQFYIEADVAGDVPGGPHGRDPRELLATIRNNHLGYAIAWYGLALALAAVYGFFLHGQRQKTEEGGE